MLVFVEGKTGVPGEKVENQQTEPTFDAESGNRTRDTLVEGERSHHCANPATAICGIIIFFFLEICHGKIHQ